MQSIPQLVNDLALLLAVAAVATIVCRRFKQPLVLGYVVAGFLVSPAIGWIPNIVETADVSTWSQIGVIFLMFGLGLQFSVVKLTTVGRPALVTAVVEMSLMIAAGFACGTLLGWSPSTSLFLGGMLAISSSSIIVKTFGELGLRTKAFAQLVFGVLVIEDIAGVFLLVVLSTVAVSASVDGGAVAVRIGRMALYLVVWFALSVILVPSALKRLRSELNDEILLIASIALCLGMVVLADAIGFSSALGAFLAGSILAGTVQAKRVDALFKPIKDLFGAVFFVSVGMLVTPAAVTENLGAIVVIALVAIIGRSLFCGLGALLSGATLKTSVMSGLSLAQIGEFSFIIAALGSATGVTPDFLYPVIVTVSVATTLASPLLVKNSERIYHLLVRVLPESLFALRHEHLERAQEEDGEPNLWVDYLKRWTLKLGLVVLAGIASVEVLMNTALPLLSGFVPEAVLNPLLAAVGIFVTGLFLSNLFYTGRKNEFGVLWMKSRRNHVPLAVLMLAGGAASCGVVAYIVHAAGARQSVWMFVLAATCSLLLARSRTLHSWFLKLETSFVGNLNESILAERLAESDEEERPGWRAPVRGGVGVAPLSISRRERLPVRHSAQPGPHGHRARGRAHGIASARATDQGGACAAHQRPGRPAGHTRGRRADVPRHRERGGRLPANPAQGGLHRRGRCRQRIVRRVRGRAPRQVGSRMRVAFRGSGLALRRQDHRRRRFQGLLRLPRRRSRA
ncbi:MAG: cation:proton antiporter [Eggerthella lenta]